MMIEQHLSEPVWQAALHEPVAFATVLLVVVTAGLWIFTGLLWRATVQLAKDAKESANAHGEKMERSIAEAVNAANAMREANQIADDSARRQLRAYVVVRKFQLEDFEVGKRPVIAYEMQNVGQTPAYNLRHSMKAFAGESLEKMSEEKVYFGAPPKIVSNVTLGSNVPAPSRMPLWAGAVTQEDYDNVINGNMVLGAFGVLSYRDIYDRRRLLTFKMMLPITGFKGGGGMLYACARGNRSN